MNENRHAGAGTNPPAIAIQAVLFDMDGVVTDTARAHAGAWKQLFDDYLKARAKAHDEEFIPFDLERDYLAHVDGKPRENGVRDFLASREIVLPEGSADDPPAPADDADRQTVHGLAQRKNGYFKAWIEQHGVRPFAGTLAFLAALRRASVSTAVFSASRNAETVLRGAGVLDLFDARVDGNEAARLHLPGKPDPALLHEAARRLGVAPGACAVIEDALAGVQAGAAGGFAQVIGVDREAAHALPGAVTHGQALSDAGAHAVVHDLAELVRDAVGRLAVKTLASLPPAWHGGEDRAGDDGGTLRARVGDRAIAAFLDYDGTLTPIVTDHTKAFLGEDMREALRRLAAHCTVAIVSGRDLAMLRRLVELDTVHYAGSHGFEIAPPKGQGDTMERGTEFLPELARAERQLRERLAGIDGHSVERKRFSIAVHFRQVRDDDVGRLEAQVRSVLADCARLRLGHGKKVFELQPAIDWHKGQAVSWLLERLGLTHDGVLPIYIGDDITDENAFRALSGRGLGIAVRDGSARPTAADLAVENVDEVRELLLLLAGIAAGRGANDGGD